MIELLLPFILILIIFGVFLILYVPFALRIKPSEKILCAAIWFDDDTHHQNQPCNENLSENCHVHYARDHRN